MSTRIRLRRAHGERGAAIVEYAFVSVILLLIVSGATDYGIAWRSGLSLTEAARTGARVGSGQADNRAADYNALTGIRAALESSGTLDGVEFVVIYRSTTASGTVPSSCARLSPTPTGTCNVLTGEQLVNLDENSFHITWAADPEDPPTGGTGCLRDSSSLRAGWCPTSRNNTQASADYYGVYIQYRQDFLFPTLGEGMTIGRNAVMRLEPPSV
jgi:Flp pilus assembly protein TadG